MRLINLQNYKLNYLQENFEMFVYTLVAFFIPLFIGHPQLAVGVVVNSMLIISALNLKGTKILPIIIAPALGVLARGVIFGPFTIYLIYLIPFIWLGNTILILCFKWLKLKLNKNYWLTLMIGVSLKTAFLFSMTYLLYSLGLIPAIFLVAMGMMQLLTAIGGGIAAYGIQCSKKKFVKF